MRALPGSLRMLGGPHTCMYARIPPFQLGTWIFDAVYMHLAHKGYPNPTTKPYDEADCQAVVRAISLLQADLRLSEGVLLLGEHAAAQGHPLPGVFTVLSAAHRVDLRAYEGDCGKEMSLWAEVYRRL